MIPNRGKSRGGSFGVIGRNLLPLLYNDGKPAPMSNGLLPLHSAQDGTESLNVADVDVIRNRPIKLCRLIYGSGYCGRLESMVKLLWCWEVHSMLIPMFWWRVDMSSCNNYKYIHTAKGTPLNLLHYIYNYCHGYVSCLPQSSCPSADFFVTCCDYDLWLHVWYDLWHNILWLLSHLCDSVTCHVIFHMLHLSNKRKKEILNNDLAILPSHNTTLYHDLAKQLSHYLYFFSFLIWTYYTRKEYKKISHNNVIYQMISYDRVT